MKLSRSFFIALCVSAFPGLALAQTQPDAGRTVQELKQPPQPSASSTNLSLALPKSEKLTPGGAKVKLQSITLHGNTVFSTSELLAVLGDYKNKSFDFAGLKNLADTLTSFYQAHGYPFARALLPAQDLSKGTLKIEIIEGRYGKIQIQSKEPRRDAAQLFLGNLHSGDLINGPQLERTSLILSDQPGYTVTPIIRPGQQTGTGDLNVEMARDKRVTGDVGIDDYGNRYTGRDRATANLAINSPFMFGDQIKLGGIYTQENMWYGALSYNMPLGISGLRGTVGYAHTYYELAKEFSSLDAHGTADIASAGVSYPIIRSQQKNLNIGATYQHKWLQDDQDSVAVSNDKTSDSLPISLNFDLRDMLGGGGITYGAASWTHGVLDLDHTLGAVDSTTAHTAGGYDKFNVDVARLQTLPMQSTFFGRFSGQLAKDNLDSSESFGLGGPNGVRAYPTGEGYGDEGWLTQLELRHAIKMFEPYVFYDAGSVRINHDAFAAGTNHRIVSGTGIGTRFTLNNWSADASLAWRLHGGDPQSDSKDQVPMLWLNAGYKF